MEEGGSRNKMHPAQKNCAGLRPRAVPSGVVRGRWRQEGAAGEPRRRVGDNSQKPRHAYKSFSGFPRAEAFREGIKKKTRREESLKYDPVFDTGK